MIKCPLGGYCYRSHMETRSEDSFALFHVYRDAYAKARGIDNIEAKNELCVKYGVAIDCGRATDEWAITFSANMFRPPKWPGVFCKVEGEWYYRKSTLSYKKAEMTDLIARTALALVEAGGEVPVRVPV